MNGNEYVIVDISYKLSKFSDSLLIYFNGQGLRYITKQIYFICILCCTPLLYESPHLNY